MKSVFASRMNRKGFTLIEILATVVILVLLVVAVGTIMTSAMKVYDESIFESDAAVLSDILDSSLGDLLRYSRSITVGGKESAPYTLNAQESPYSNEETAELSASAFCFTNLDYGVKNGYLSLNDNNYLCLNSIGLEDSTMLVNEGAYAGGLHLDDLTINYYPLGAAVEEGDDNAEDDGGYFEVNYTISGTGDKSEQKMSRTSIVRLMNADVSSNMSSGERVEMDRGTHEEDEGPTEHIVHYYAHKPGEYEGAEMVYGGVSSPDLTFEISGSREITLLGRDYAVLKGYVLSGWKDDFDNTYALGSTWRFSKVVTLYGDWKEDPNVLTVSLKRGADLKLSGVNGDGSRFEVLASALSADGIQIDAGVDVSYSFVYEEEGSYPTPKVYLIQGNEIIFSLEGQEGSFKMPLGSATLEAYLPYEVTWSLGDAAADGAKWDTNSSADFTSLYYKDPVTVPNVVYPGRSILSWESSVAEAAGPSRGARTYEPTCSLKLTAQFEENRVRFFGDPTDAEGGLNLQIGPCERDYADLSESDMHAYADGWVFIGWFDSIGNRYPTLKSIQDGLKNGSLDLFAHWVQLDTAVSLSPRVNGITLENISAQTAEDTSLFLGWYSDDNTFLGYDSVRTSGWTWRKVIHGRTVTFEKVENETINYSEAEVDESSGEFTLPTASYPGTDNYFLGWWDARDYGRFRGVAAAEIKAEKNLTLYPRWVSLETDTENTDFDDAEVTVDSGSGSFTVSMGDSVQPFPGYTFIGWYRVENGSSSRISDTFGASLTARLGLSIYSASLQENKVYLEFLAEAGGKLSLQDGESEITSTQFAVPVGAVTGVAPEVTAVPDSGYRHSGWFERTKDGFGNYSDVKIPDAKETLKVSKNEQGIYSAASYVAKFVKNLSKITVVAGDHATVVDGSGEDFGRTTTFEKSVGTKLIPNVSSINLVEDSTTTAIRIVPDFGYKVTGLSFEIDGVPMADFESYTLDSSALTVTAAVEPLTYTVTYKYYDGENLDSEVTETYSYGTGVELWIPTNANKEFVGWFVESDISTPDSSKLEEGVDYIPDVYDYLWNYGTVLPAPTVEGESMLAPAKDGYTYGSVTLRAEWETKTCTVSLVISEGKVDNYGTYAKQSQVIVKREDLGTEETCTLERNKAYHEQTILLENIPIGASVSYDKESQVITIGKNGTICTIKADPGTRGAGTNYYKTGIGVITRRIVVRYPDVISSQNHTISVSFNRGGDYSDVTFAAGEHGKVSIEDMLGRYHNAPYTFNGETYGFKTGEKALGITNNTVTYTTSASGATRTVTSTPNSNYVCDGWTAVFEDGTEQKLEIGSYTLAEDVTIRADFIPVAITVRVEAGTGGTVSGAAFKEITARYGDTISASGAALTFADGTVVTASANTGYHFSKWTGIPDTLTESCTITAEFAGNEAIFDANGGNFEGENTYGPVAYQEGVSILEGVPTPTRAGYEFTKWYANAACTADVGSNPIPRNEDAPTTYYAGWKNLMYNLTVSADANGSVTVKDASGANVSPIIQVWSETPILLNGNQLRVNNSSGVTVSANPTGNAGYDFKEWQIVNSDETFTTLVSGSPVQPDMRVRAAFIGYEMVFDAGEGTFGEEGSTRTLNYTGELWSSKDSTVVPTREGYTFIGWLAENGGTPAIPETNGTRYIANWQVNTYQVYVGVTTNGDASSSGGHVTLTGAVAPFTAYYSNTISGLDGDTVTVAVKSPADAAAADVTLQAVAADGYHFTEWTEEDNRGASDPSSRTYELTANFVGNKVIFNANGGSVEGNETYTDDLPYAGKILFPEDPLYPGNEFLGWFEADDETQVTAGSKPLSDPTYYHAKWAKGNYTITYAGTEGAELSQTYTGTYTISDTISLPDASKLGYTFDGWKVTAADENSSWKVDDFFDLDSLTVSNGQYGNVTLTAQWTADTYTITYLPNNGTVNNDGTLSYTIEDTVTLATASRVGYDLDGWKVTATDTVSSWSVGQTYTTPAADGDGKVYGSVTLEAQWAAGSYTVNYNGNGSDGGSTASSQHTYGTASALTANGFTRTGYTFAGWNTAADGSGDPYADGASVSTLTDSASITLYAQWTANTYTVSYLGNESDGGSTESSQHTYGTASALTENGFTRTGYTFAGWNTQADGTGTDYTNGQSVTNLTTSGTFILYAQWTPNTYTVNYDGNGATYGNTTSTEHTYDVEKALNVNSFIKTGYSFTGWNTQADGKGTAYAAGAMVKNLASSGSITLYAQWSAYSYTVEYDGNNADSGSMNPSSYEFDESKALTANAFSKTGYTFTEWNTAANGSGDSYADGAEVSNLSSTNGDTVTLYAQWAANSYTIAFDANGGEGSMGSMSMTYDQAKNLSTNGYSREGYSFNGWNTVADGSGNSYADGAEVSNLTAEPNGAVTLYAQWFGYTVTYDPNEGTVDSGSTSETYSGELHIPSVTRFGYRLQGWFAADGSQISKSTVPEGNVTYTARWVALPYYVTYNGAGGTFTPTDEKISYNYGDSVTMPTVADRLGYTFGGWKAVVSEGTTNNWTDDGGIYVSGQVVTGKHGDVTLVAQWTPAQYTIHYDVNGGSTVDDQIYSYGSTFSLAAAPTKSEKYFSGWMVTSAEDGSSWTEATYAAGKSLSGQFGNVTLQAQWDDLTKPVTLTVGDHGSVVVKKEVSGGASSSETVTGSKVINVPTGSTWSASGKDSVVFTDGTTTITLTADGERYIINDYKAVWSTSNLVDPVTKACSVSVSFVRPTESVIQLTATPNDSSMGMVSPSSAIAESKFSYSTDGNVLIVTGTVDGSVTMKATAYDYYHFVNWSSTGGNNIRSTTEVTAYFAPNEIKLDPDGGTFTNDELNRDPTMKYEGTAIQLPTAGEITNGLDTFLGWYDENGTLITEVYPLENGKTYKAHWTETQYNITYKDGDSVVKSDTYSRKGYTLWDGSTLSKTGYHIDKWIPSGGSGWDSAGYAPGAQISGMTGDVVLTAHWEPNVYTITYYTNGGNISENPQTYTIKDSVTLLVPEKKDGDFEGWNTKADFTGEWVTGIPEGSTGDQEFYAKWIRKYKITVSTSNAKVTITVGGEEIASKVDKGDYYVVPGKKVEVTTDYSYDDRKSTTITWGGGQHNSPFDMPEEDVAISASSSCVAAGTLITLANGKQVPVEKLQGNEMLLVWNLDTGRYDAAPIVFVDSDPTAEYEIIHLYFEDGTDVKVISEHGFFDLDLGEYVYLDENAADYIGHRFVKRNGRRWTTVKLTDVVLEKEVTEAYSPVTYGHLCYYVNGMLSMPGGISGLFNIYDVDVDTMSYDAVKKAKDIKTYGQFTFDDFGGMISEEAFGAFNGADLKVAMGKGILTWDDVAYMAERYMPLVEEN